MMIFLLIMAMIATNSILAGACYLLYKNNIWFKALEENASQLIIWCGILNNAVNEAAVMLNEQSPAIIEAHNRADQIIQFLTGKKFAKYTKQDLKQLN